MHDRSAKFARDLRHDRIDGGVRADEQDATTNETVGTVVRIVQHAPVCECVYSDNLMR